MTNIIDRINKCNDFKNYWNNYFTEVSNPPNKEGVYFNKDGDYVGQSPKIVYNHESKVFIANKINDINAKNTELKLGEFINRAIWIFGEAGADENIQLLQSHTVQNLMLLTKDAGFNTDWNSFQKARSSPHLDPKDYNNNSVYKRKIRDYFISINSIKEALLIDNSFKILLKNTIAPLIRNEEDNIRGGLLNGYIPFSEEEVAVTVWDPTRWGYQRDDPSQGAYQWYGSADEKIGGYYVREKDKNGNYTDVLKIPSSEYCNKNFTVAVKGMYVSEYDYKIAFINYSPKIYGKTNKYWLNDFHFFYSNELGNNGRYKYRSCAIFQRFTPALIEHLASPEVSGPLHNQMRVRKYLGLF